MDETADKLCEPLRRSIEAERVHSAYLFAGVGERPAACALWFARALACTGDGESGDGAAVGDAARRPCEACPACRRSDPGELIPLDGTGRSGPLLRHIGTHPDLVWVERGAGDTRVRIGQIRAMQEMFQLRTVEGGRRAGVVADAEWLNQEAQNALLRLLEEPPPATTLLLVSAQPAGLLATVRSRCQRLQFPPERKPSPLAADAPEEAQAEAARLARIAKLSESELLDWAEEFRGPRQVTAPALTEWLALTAAWLHEKTCTAALAGENPDARLEAWAVLNAGRKSLAQRNANPQMVAERVLFALREAMV